MWYFYEDEEDEGNQEGLDGVNRDWSEEEEAPEEEQQDDNSDSNNRRDKKDKDGEDASSDQSQGDASQGNEELDPDKVKNDMKDTSDELDKQNQAKNGGQESGKGTGQNSANDLGKNASKDGAKDGIQSGAKEGSKEAGKNLGKETGKEAGKELGKEAGKEAGKELGKEAGKKAAVSAGTKGGAAAAGSGAAASGAAAGAGAAGGAGGGAIFATPVGWIILLVIVIIIVLIGTISFFMLMPGQIMQKLKSFSFGLFNFMAGLVNGKENVVYYTELAEIANYLEEKGYDLKGEGFVTWNLKDSDRKDMDDKEGNRVVNKDEQTLDSVQGIMRRDSGEVTYILSDPIHKYIVSDNLCYLIRNHNNNLKTATEEEGGFFWAALKFLANPIGAYANLGNPNWGTGLISVYWEGDNIGDVGKFFSHIDSKFDTIEVDAETKKLIVKRGWTNKGYEFDLDGWTGRYGMPLEFLLSVHLATQMPDLAMEMSTAFDTEVKLVLHKVDKAEVSGAYSEDGSTYITLDDFEEANKAGNPGKYYVLFKKGLPHKTKAYDDEDSEGTCTCCSHIPGHAGKLEDEECSSSDGNLSSENFDLGKHTICDVCKKHIDNIESAIKEVDVDKLTTFTPYIGEVSNHWFRDVKFTINNINDTGVIINDENYYYETGERWSVYETYKEGDSLPEGFVVGDYKLYTYNSSDNTYTEFTGSKAEAEKIKKAIEDGDTSVTRLVKKPVTKLLSEIKDAEGNSVITGINGDRWSAYRAGKPVEGSWTELSVNDDSPDSIKKNKGKIYYKEAQVDTIEQVEDGQRLATNPEIKHMFLDKKYYKYDGSVKKADKIMEDRAAHSSEDDVKKYNTENDPRDQTLLSKVSVTKDSLAAFSILENTHTLDADYIYRDFKELIVELDYFDKEDLSDKIGTVMTWPLPQTGSSGWPIRKYEKGEFYYGTLINSKEDLKLLRSADVEEAKALLEGLDGEATDEKVNKYKSEHPDSDKSDKETTSETTGKLTNTQPTKTGLIVGKNPKRYLASSTSTGSGSSPVGTVDGLVNVGYEVHKVMEGTNWDYCILGGGCEHVNGNSCGLDSTIQAAQSGHHNSCCATFVSWVLKEAGFDMSECSNMNCCTPIYEWGEKQGFTPITSYDEMEPGDILFNNCGADGTSISQIGHVQMLGNDGEWLNAGSQSAITSAPKAYKTGFIIALRTNLNGSKGQFMGYEPEEPVVSPITGKILEYGTVVRPNEETGEDEEVGFIKIEAMDSYMYNEDGKGYTKCKNSSDDETFDKKASDKDKKYEGYDYFYDEYRGIMDGFVLYIEGFDLTLDDPDNTVIKKGKDAETEIKEEENAMALYKKGDYDELKNLSKYEKNDVYNMTDDLEEARSWWREDAKASALPIQKVGDDWYIKEGTIVGKTCKDPEEDETKEAEDKSKDSDEKEESKTSAGNGNYMRLILRNLEDSIIEDVESYFPLDDAKASTPVAFEQLAYFIGPLEEGVIEKGGDYGVEVLADGAGNTTSFGLTSAVFSGKVQETWPQFKTHLQSGTIPRDEAQDVFILVLEAAKEEIQKKANDGENIDENYLYALIDLHHASPANCYEAINILNSTGKLTVKNFEDLWGSNTTYERPLKIRAHNRGLLATEGRFLDYRGGAEGSEFKFNTETPWTEFCDGGGTSELAKESSGIYTVEPHADSYSP